MAWVAVDRALKFAEEMDLEGGRQPHEARDDDARGDLPRGLRRGTQHVHPVLRVEQLDASLLLIPQVGFLPPDDPRVVGTVEAIQRELVKDGFVMRYIPDEGAADGLPPGEGAFLACSFWLVVDLALIGRRDEAKELFERLLSLKNDLGLFSEEYDQINQRLIGNSPQAFTHLTLIAGAKVLSDSPADEGGAMSTTQEALLPTGAQHEIRVR